MLLLWFLLGSGRTIRLISGLVSRSQTKSTKKAPINSNYQILLLGSPNSPTIPTARSCTQSPTALKATTPLPRIEIASTTSSKSSVRAVSASSSLAVTAVLAARSATSSNLLSLRPVRYLRSATFFGYFALIIGMILTSYYNRPLCHLCWCHQVHSRRHWSRTIN